MDKHHRTNREGVVFSVPWKPQEFLTDNELAERWCISPSKLQADRWKGTGCAYLKIGRLVRYAIADIQRFENSAKMNLEGQNDV